MSTNDSTDLTPNITKLQLSDDFYTWFLTTNKLIDYVNPIQLYDINVGHAFTETRSNGIVTIDLNLGKGLKLFPSIGSGNLTIGLEELYSSTETVQNGDYILVERPYTGESNYLFAVQAEDMLPDVLNGDHLFSGDITVNALNVNDNVIRLQYGNRNTSNNSGIILDTTASEKVKFTYNTTKSAWISNRNIGVENGYSYVSNNVGKDAMFRYSTTGSQYDVILELAMGVQSTTADDASWLIEAKRLQRKLDFVYRNSLTTDLDRSIFYALLDDDYGYGSTFVIADKIQIGNIGQSSTNFKSATNYAANIVPISNSYGVLDSKWTNRYVTTNYSGVSVGDIVSIYDHTSGNALVTKENISTNEMDSHPIGIVERISGGVAYIAMLGEFELQSTPSTPLVAGLTYYMSTGTPNYSLSKPITGITKPLFIATGPKSGLIFPMSSGALSYGQISVNKITGESGYIVGSGEAVYSNTTNGNIRLIAGQGISIESNNTTKEITLRALTQGNEPGYATIHGDTGTVLQAVRPNDTLNITGNGGGIRVTTLDSTNADNVILEGRYFRHVGITGDDTNQDSVTLTAGADDTLTLYGGVGIRLSNPTGNLIRFEATGDLAATIPNYSLTLKQFQKQGQHSVLISGAGTSSSPTMGEVKALQVPSINSAYMFMYAGFNTMSWTTPANFFKTFVSTPVGGIIGNVLPTASRFMGISVHTPGTTTPIGTTNGTASFVVDDTWKPNGITNLRMALIQGDGITLSVVNNTGSSDWVGVPAIKISNNDTTSKFKNVLITNTNETISADTSGYLRLTSPSGSPISLDGDSNSDTVYFDITDNSITNSHLALMPDNTVKVGSGGTGSQEPHDLLIGQYSVLGRLGGDLQTLNANNLRTILSLSGSDYFSSIRTDSGIFYASESEELSLRGGTGISVSVGTDNNILITNTLPLIDGLIDVNALGINTVGYRDLLVDPNPVGDYDVTVNDMATGVNKLYFGIGDLNYEFYQRDSGVSVKPYISWSTIGKSAYGDVNDYTEGSGLIYGYSDSLNGVFVTKFAQIGNGRSGWQIPYIDADTQELSYVTRNNIQQNLPSGGDYNNAHYRLTFANDGRLTKTNDFVRTMSSSISGLQITPRYQSYEVPEYVDPTDFVLWDSGDAITVNQLQTTSGMYWSPLSAIQLEPTEGKGFGFLTTNSQSAFTDLVYLTFGSDLVSPDTQTFNFNEAGPRITIKTFSNDWYSLGTSKMCFGTVMFGVGPTTSTSTASTGYLVTNDSTKGSLVFTNYNFNTSGAKNIEKDRSSRISLQVLNADSQVNNAYAAVKTTGSIAHTYSVTTDVVDRFTLSANSYSSVKYLIQAISSTYQVFTSEFIVQTNTTGVGSCKYIQYASISQDGGFTLDITAELSGNVVTVKHNGSAITANISLIKVMKQEI